MVERKVMLTRHSHVRFTTLLRLLRRRRSLLLLHYDNVYWTHTRFFTSVRELALFWCTSANVICACRVWNGAYEGFPFEILVRMASGEKRAREKERERANDSWGARSVLICRGPRDFHDSSPWPPGQRRRLYLFCAIKIPTQTSIVELNRSKFVNNIP